MLSATRSIAARLPPVGLLTAAVLLPGPATATPPHYKSFDRDQVIDHAPATGDVLRIWMVYVGQGDGLVIELPRRFGDESASPGPLVVVDGGAHGRMAEFLERLAPDGARGVRAVLTHHDHDHAGGFQELLRMEDFSFGPLFHNGLATWTPEQGEGEDGGLVEVTKSASGGTWFLGRFDPETGAIRSEDLVDDAGELEAALDAGRLTGVYAELALAFVEGHGTGAGDGRTFPRASLGRPFLGAPEEAPSGRPAPVFELLWPPEPPRRFDDWSHTINGDSVTFRLRYGDFAMLFTGDHNKPSERAILDHYAPDPSVFACDVLKVPHHGSSHNVEELFEAADPVLGVASMGGRGFTPSWRHPSENVISWLGGSHRAYHTHIHESRFDWEDLSERADRLAMVEERHILIETDGVWFRLVEVPIDGDLREPPGVRETVRGDGTRWVRAVRGDDANGEDDDE